VLCEKPFTANAIEAREVAGLAAKSDRVVMEAFHYRWHPLALRIEQIVESGELGTLDTFAAAVLHGQPVETTPQDATENMTVIDAIYRAAGLPLRQPS
jgi:predicted dehydrogenase